MSHQCSSRFKIRSQPEVEAKDWHLLWAISKQPREAQVPLLDWLLPSLQFKHAGLATEVPPASMAGIYCLSCGTRVGEGLGGGVLAVCACCPKPSPSPLYYKLTELTTGRAGYQYAMAVDTLLNYAEAENEL